MVTFEELTKLRELNKLKSTYRRAKVKERQESVAEHTWGCLMLAKYFGEEMKLNLDMQKVYELLIFHDVAEINIGDVPIATKQELRERENEERENLVKISKGLPKRFGKNVLELSEEFESAKTMEAKFAKIIDCIEANLQGIDNDRRVYWKGWGEETIKRIYQKRFHEVPGFAEFFEDMIKWLLENGYLSERSEV